MKIKNVVIEFVGFAVGGIVGRFFSEDWKASSIGSAVGWIAAKRLNEEIDVKQGTNEYEISYHSNHVKHLEETCSERLPSDKGKVSSFVERH